MARVDVRRRPWAAVSIDVPFHDVDAMRIVWHGRYVKYLEVARVALMRTLGFDDLEVHAQGWMFPVVDLRLRYLASARAGQRLLVRADLAEHQPMVRIRYQVRDAADGRWLARASTVQAPVEVASGLLCTRPPAVLLARFDAALAAWSEPDA